jgi:hypothetical protein
MSFFDDLFSGGGNAYANLGLNDAQQRLLQYGGILNAGANLLAAAQPQTGAQRAARLAQLGNVPAQQQRMAYAMGLGNRLGILNNSSQFGLDEDQEVQRILQRLLGMNGGNGTGGLGGSGAPPIVPPRRWS